MRIAIIVGSTRPGRKGTTVGRWVHDQALQRDDVPGKVDFDLLELEDFDLPLLDEPTVPAVADQEYEVPETRAPGAGRSTSTTATCSSRRSTTTAYPRR
jgi:NAD(P)H-dependent FMN reductase